MCLRFIRTVPASYNIIYFVSLFVVGDHGVHTDLALLWLHTADGVHVLARHWNHRLLRCVLLHQTYLRRHQDRLTLSPRACVLNNVLQVCVGVSLHVGVFHAGIYKLHQQNENRANPSVLRGWLDNYWVVEGKLPVSLLLLSATTYVVRRDVVFNLLNTLKRHLVKRSV